MPLRPRHVRTRLTLWYLAILALALLIYAAATAALVLYQLRDQLDRLAIQDLETVEGFLQFSPSGALTLREDYHDHPYPANVAERLMEVYDPSGQLLYRNRLLANRSLGPVPAPTEGAAGYNPHSLRLSDGTPVRVVSKRHSLHGRPVLIRVGFSEAPLYQRLRQVTLGLLAGLPLALALIGFAGYFLARRALAPLERMTRRAREIHAHRLNARLEVENPADELGQLALAFNDTLARLERSFEELRRFTADASHELRTPLTALRAAGEVALRQPISPAQYREGISSMLEEAARLTHIVDSLLLLARADFAPPPLQREPVHLLPLVRGVASTLEVLAEEKHQCLAVEGDPTLAISADPAVLRRVLMNLAGNAIKYSPSGTTITLRVRSLPPAAAAVEVADQGPGIAAEHRPHIFERFYRADSARSRETGGAGLGLAIANQGALAHGGRLELDCPLHGGAIFRLILPTTPCDPIPT
jgi:heavy metal sensor kinase